VDAFDVLGASLELACLRADASFIIQPTGCERRVLAGDVERHRRRVAELLGELDDRGQSNVSCPSIAHEERR
jgi:hypothetical protein